VVVSESRSSITKRCFIKAFSIVNTKCLLLFKTRKDIGLTDYIIIWYDEAVVLYVYLKYGDVS